MPGRKIDPVKAERARERVRRAMAKRDAASEKLNDSIDRLYSEVYRASQEGATYVQLAETLGVSKVRVFQILQEQRNARAS